MATKMAKKTADAEASAVFLTLILRIAGHAG
jgi:hypothetical protein